MLQDAADAAGLELTWTTNLTEFLEKLSSRSWSTTFLSLSVDPVDEDVAKRVGSEPNAGALLLSAPGASLERALLVERAGAVALFHEPLQPSPIRSRLIAVLEEGKVVQLPETPDAEPDAGPVMVGTGPEMAEIFNVLAQVASSPATVLVTGESGTGKELIAQAVHWASDRKDGPFVAVNCAAIPEHLLESELFGHERGAFTGAVARRSGRFERAHGGTLFLDEIGDMSLVLQAKILRVLEEHEHVLRGGRDPPASNVGGELPVGRRGDDSAGRSRGGRDPPGPRATHRSWRVPRGSLLPVGRRGAPRTAPEGAGRRRGPRELALHYAAHFTARYDRPVEGITEEVIERLQAYHWPGNVRELRNVLDRAVLLSRGGVLRLSELRLGAASPRASSRSESESISGYPRPSP